MANNFILVGNNHESEAYMLWKALLMQRASQKKIVLGLEGVIRDPKAEALSATGRGVDQGYIFGLEHPLVHAYIDTTLGYGNEFFLMNGVEVDRGWREQVIYNLEFSQEMRESWAAIGPLMKGLIGEPLYGYIDSYWKGMQEKSPEEKASRMVRFSRESASLGNELMWAQLFHRLADELKPRLTDLSYQPDYKVIDRYMSDPVRNQTEFLDKINGDWRDLFLHDNMRYNAKIASDNKLDAINTIGEGHIPNLSTKFKRTFHGLRVHIYPTMADVPRLHWGF